MKARIASLAAVWLLSHPIAPVSAQNKHIIEVLSTTTLFKVNKVPQALNTSSSSASLLPSWNASVAFTFLPTNSSSAASAARTTTTPQGGLLPSLTAVIGNITSGLGNVTSGLGLGASPTIAGRAANTTSPSSFSFPSLSMPSLTFSSLSMPSLTFSSLTMPSLSLTFSSIRWPNNTATTTTPASSKAS
ncbi:hypothetical protein B0H67DRAFT_551357 [Lasiosphaeris hirsuta]|uniref:Uncharacterized protein n=1 Tax=Lasiosphaeris hirsuta TaxID=260670 RepID=A0AA40B1M5_9PEZI|nr:hypothetical protein B0H67DRAFT_551357 [Lasiosphaeris hirsuta]